MEAVRQKEPFEPRSVVIDPPPHDPVAQARQTLRLALTPPGNLYRDPADVEVMDMREFILWAATESALRRLDEQNFPNLVYAQWRVRQWHATRDRWLASDIIYLTEVRLSEMQPPTTIWLTSWGDFLVGTYEWLRQRRAVYRVNYQLSIRDVAHHDNPLGLYGPTVGALQEIAEYGYDAVSHQPSEAEGVLVPPDVPFWG